MTREEAIERIKARFDKWALDDEDMKAIQTLVPELRESEDERIRKAIVETIKQCPDTFLNPKNRDDMVAYLEKQKEATPCSVDEFTLTLRNCLSTDSELTKEQADIFATVYGKELFNVAIGKLKSGLTKEDIADFKTEKQKEQKSVEPSDDELQRHQDELYAFKVFAAKQAKEYHISYVHDFEWNNFCAEILSYFNEQKPTEWSEEDENVIETLIRELRLNAQFEYAVRKLGLDYVQTLTVLDKCRRLYPQSHWKPSEEQMGALNYAYCELFKREDVSHNILGPLQNLIDTLSKL